MSRGKSDEEQDCELHARETASYILHNHHTLSICDYWQDAHVRKWPNSPRSRRRW